MQLYFGSALIYIQCGGKVDIFFLIEGGAESKGGFFFTILDYIIGPLNKTHALQVLLLYVTYLNLQYFQMKRNWSL